MKIFTLLSATLLAALFALTAQAQGGVTIGAAGAPAASAVLELKSTTQGLLLPRLSLAQRTAMGTGTIAAPVPGLVIYQTDNTPGLYAYDGAAWVRLGPDNLGNHTATTNVGLNNNWLSNAPGNANGIQVDNSGNVFIGGTGTRPGFDHSTLEVAGTVAAPFTNLSPTANYYDLSSGGAYYTVRLSPTINSLYIRLPPPFFSPGRIYVLLNTSGFPISLPPTPPVIDETNTTLNTLPARSRLSIQSDGNNNWYVIGR
ncbi:MAG: hypothetical protein M3Y54_04355 [Bacteroidota bacterium]|nr:hypothetical protein [Bacteroidota bacterium]